jgi:hypothetical protein
LSALPFYHKVFQNRWKKHQQKLLLQEADNDPTQLAYNFCLNIMILFFQRNFLNVLINFTDSINIFNLKLLVMFPGMKFLKMNYYKRFVV